MSVLDLCSDKYSRADLAGYQDDLRSLTFEVEGTDWATKCTYCSLACIGLMLVSIFALLSK